MGAELFEMSWVQGIVQFFNYLAWTLYVIGLIVACFECGINYAGGKGDIRAVALNAIKGFMAASLFSVVPVRLYQLAISLQAEFTSGMTGYGTSIGEVAANIIQEYEEIETVADLIVKPISGFEAVTSPIMVIVCIIMMAYAVIKVFFANLKRGGILLIQIAVGSLYMFSIRAKTVYMYLRDRSDKERKCWPGINTIAAELNCSRSTVKRALHDLEKHGYMRRLPRYRESGSRSSNLYVLVDD